MLTPASIDGLPPAVVIIIETYAEAIRVPIELVLILTIFSSMLIPILITLFWLSTHSVRRQPIFVLNVASIATGIGVAILGIYDGLFPVLNPTAPAGVTSDSVFICALLLAPWLAELVLAFRLAAVFPPSQTSKRKLAAILVFPLTVKCARLGCCIALCTMWIRTDRLGFDSVLSQAGNSEWRKYAPYHIAELFLQIFDNTYLSTLFIWKLHCGHIFRAQDVQRVSLGFNGSLASRLRMLFWIAIGNFVFPILFNIAIIIDVFVDPQYMLRIPNLLLTNYYLSIIGVVFATVWSSSKSRRSSSAGSLPPGHDEAKTGTANPVGVIGIGPGPGVFGSAARKTYTWAPTWTPNSSQEGFPLTVAVRTEGPQRSASEHVI